MTKDTQPETEHPWKPGSLVLDKETMTSVFMVMDAKPLSQTKLPCFYASIPKEKQVKRLYWRKVGTKTTPVPKPKEKKELKAYPHRSSIIKSPKYGDLTIVHLKAIVPILKPEFLFQKWHDELLVEDFGPELYEMMHDMGKGDIYKKAAVVSKLARNILKKEAFEEIEF